MASSADFTFIVQQCGDVISLTVCVCNVLSYTQNFVKKINVAVLILLVVCLKTLRLVCHVVYVAVREQLYEVLL